MDILPALRLRVCATPSGDLNVSALPASARTTVLDPSVSMSAVGHSTVKSPQLKMRTMTCGGLCMAPHGHCM